MASQVLSGSSNPSYTNNTGKNVRIVINYMRGRPGITINWAGVSASAPNALAIGRNLAFHGGLGTESLGLNAQANNMIVVESGAAQRQNEAVPTEVMLSSGQAFSASCGVYNIIVIKEDGS